MAVVLLAPRGGLERDKALFACLIILACLFSRNIVFLSQ